MISVIREIINEEFSLPRERIASLAARKLGFASAGAKISETINALLAVLERQGVVKVNGTLVTMNF